jgi:hypothetical protein
MEDIDVGMPNANGITNRMDESDDEEEIEEDRSKGSRRNKSSKPSGGVTLSGLLNAIVSGYWLENLPTAHNSASQDGVAGGEGRICEIAFET